MNKSSNRHNWLILLAIAAVMALLAAVDVINWNQARWSMGTLVLASALTLALSYCRQMHSPQHNSQR
ncbi:hypothetical protein F7230_03325 [Corynebacterium sp. 320]|uniref:hypothetical protein n=1 Tax=Corynebacterium TaxID=1716 RepID=UPI00125CC784|nr:MULTISPECIES: hypothetical protein [Corynebacterium]KAB1504135.1 hypothetical protein F7230_03325 [Corynebacterium sp. 320]KAB1552765.1 hypothetical protein F7233_03265 [Corynebacterium sp. 321]KAB1554017.1 hypothetical protein F7232_03320 [Corynebacterium sp. 319]KAB3528271.1 hypothetical protein F8354_03325 [Corynebacterium sp. 250]KAB3540240.1 hypothetical protein F8390_03010 [Corynebacterium sp. 366]